MNNAILLISRYQLLLARRAVRANFYFSIVFTLIFFGLICFFVPYNYFILALPVIAFYCHNIISLSLMRASYEIDASHLSVYPLSDNKKLYTLFWIDVLHVNVVVYTVCFMMLMTESLMHYTIIQTALSVAVFTVYWILFSVF